MRFMKYSVLLSKMLQKREGGTKNWAGGGEGGSRQSMGETTMILYFSGKTKKS